MVSDEQARAIEAMTARLMRVGAGAPAAAKRVAAPAPMQRPRADKPQPMTDPADRLRRLAGPKPKARDVAALFAEDSADAPPAGGADGSATAPAVEPAIEPEIAALEEFLAEIIEEHAADGVVPEDDMREGARDAAALIEETGPPRATPAPPALRPDRSRDEALDDESWALDNLRWQGDHAFGDLANVLRIFNRHPDFVGRFIFNKGMGKVIDRGGVMLGWQIDELAAVVQERFLPEVSSETVLRALMVCANRNATGG